jgi:hypothetical protein
MIPTSTDPLLRHQESVQKEFQSCSSSPDVPQALFSPVQSCPSNCLFHTLNSARFGGLYFHWSVDNSKELDRLEMPCEAHFSMAFLLRKYLFMKLAPMTKASELEMVQSCSRLDCTRVMTLSLVVTGTLLLQGCLAGAWVAAVSVDSMRSSNVTFEPFEQSWVAKQDQSSDAVPNVKVTSVAVLPVEGDPEMGARLVTLLQQETALRVDAPTTGATEVSAHDPGSATADDADRSVLAKEITRDLGVDTVLVSRVTSSPAHPTHPSDWGWKTEDSRRLYLYLINRDGRLLWKDELPFTLVKGSTSQQEASMQTDLSDHVMQHVKELRLDELGYLPKKTFH